ncbi:S-layer homology domain-containing protein [Calidifontibacillus erzurumensis]|uniref:S-layer homology domain-containing protein n=1 Tax=Calidifontibacillus erzurumensis TaxID=2741433 RepID=UPI0035B552B3
MKNKKKFQKKLATTVASAFFITAAATPFMSENVQAASKFKDIPSGAFYEKAVQHLSEKGVIGGYNDGTFKPNKAVTRAEAAKMLAYDLGLEAPTETSTNFKDVKKGDWYYEPVMALSQAGGISGYENGTFGPNKTITRAEMSSMLVKAYGIQANIEGEQTPFTDVPPTSWFAGAVQTLYKNNITSGKSQTKFAPNDPVTRGEIAAFIQKVNEAKNNSDETKKSTIEINEDNTVTIAGTTYKIPASLSGIFNKENAKILANAEIKLEENNGTITKITYLQLNTSGQPATNGQQEFSNNLVLDGKGNTIAGTLKVNANYITIKNVTIEGDLEITPNLANDFYSENITVKGQTIVSGGDSNTVVFKNAKLGIVAVNKKGVRLETKGKTSINQLNIHTNAHIAADEQSTIQKTIIQNGSNDVQLDGPFEMVEVQNNQAATIKGNAFIKELQLKQNANLALQIKNKIALLKAEKGAKFSLGSDTAIGHLQLPYGIQATDVITNFNDRKNNIEKTNNETNPEYKDPTLTPGGGGGGGAVGKPSADSILNSYKDDFEQLKNKAETDFNNLLTDFVYNKIEFSEALNQGKEKYKYYESSFNNMYNELVNDLKSNGYSEDHAKVVKDTFDSLVGPYSKFLE